MRCNGSTQVCQGLCSHALQWPQEWPLLCQLWHLCEASTLARWRTAGNRGCCFPCKLSCMSCKILLSQAVKQWPTLDPNPAGPDTASLLSARSHFNCWRCAAWGIYIYIIVTVQKHSAAVRSEG